MSTVRFTAEVLPDGTLRLPEDVQLAPGKAEVTVKQADAAPTRHVPPVARELAELAKLTHTTEFRDDHDQLVVHFERIGALVEKIASGAREGDLGPARGIGPAATRIFCETEKSLTSEEFKAIVAVHIGRGPPGRGDCE